MAVNELDFSSVPWPRASWEQREEKNTEQFGEGTSVANANLPPGL